MKLIVDTQCWLWMNAAPDRLRPSTRALLERATTQPLLSAASAWEIAIKTALGKLQLPDSPSEYVRERLRRTRTVPLPITHEHALGVADLPPLHRDPFDRLLVSQALIEGLPILTADSQLTAYDIDTIDA